MYPEWLRLWLSKLVHTDRGYAMRTGSLRFRPGLLPLEDRFVPTGMDALLGSSIDSTTVAITSPEPSVFAGGVRVAAGDVTGDGYADLVTASGPGGAALIRVFDGKTGEVAWEFDAYYPAFRGGATVAVGDVTGDGRADIVTGADQWGGPHVRVFDGTSHQIVGEFFAYDPAFRGGVRVAVGDATGDGRPDIVTGAGPGGGPHKR